MNYYHIMIFASGMYDYNNNTISCEIIILQIYDRNKYYIIEVPDIKGTQ